MKITDISQYIWEEPGEETLIVRVDTDEGIFGAGDATVKGRLNEISLAIEKLARGVIGLEAYDIEGWFSRAFSADPMGRGKVWAAAIAGIETACWDAIGKKTGQPVYNLMGGAMRRDVILCLSGWSEGCQTPEDFASAAASVAAKGYGAIKMKPLSGLLDERIAMRRLYLPEALNNVRAASGCCAELYLDLEEKLDFDQALWFSKQLDDIRIGYLQDPLRHYDADGFQKLSRACNIPLATGGGLSGRHDFKAVMEAGNCSVLQPDPILCGGVMETKKIVSLAEAYFLKFSATDTGSPIGLMVSAHIGVTVPNTLRAECRADTPELARRLFNKELDIRDGALLIGDEPGLGLVPDFGKLRRVASDSGRIRA